jgi:hypothetical protein
LLQGESLDDADNDDDDALRALRRAQLLHRAGRDARRRNAAEKDAEQVLFCYICICCCCWNGFNLLLFVVVVV